MRVSLVIAVLLAAVTLSTAYSYGRYRYGYKMKPYYKRYHGYNYYDDHHDSHHDDDYYRSKYRYAKSHHDDSHHDSRHEDSHHDSRYTKSHHDSQEDSHHDSRPAKSHHDDSHHSEEHHSEEHHDDDDDHHVYTFQIAENYGAYEYMDDEGYAKGFNIDMMEHICAIAHKECHFVMDKHSNCWETVNGHEYPGTALLARWYDGCVGLFPSPERSNAFQFSESFTTNFKAGIFYHEGSGLMGDDVHNLTNHKIGFMDGWAVNQHCLERQKEFYGNHPGDYEAVMFDTHENMHKALMEDTIDAGMTVDAFEAGALEIAHAEPLFECTTGGLALMTQKGNHIVDWWNDAFHQMIDSGEYKEMCNEAATKHADHGKVHCIE